MTTKDKTKITTAKLTQLVQEFEQQAVSSPAEWVSFLTIASNLSNYGPSDQLLVYGQNPAATAVTTYDFWMNRVKRSVKKNAKGIALLPRKSAQSSSIRYVFDVSDTNDGYYDVTSGKYIRADNARMYLPNIIRRRDEESVLAMLRRNSNVAVSLPESISIEEGIRETARQRVEANFRASADTIIHYAEEGSAFVSLKKERQEELIRQVLTASATYLIGHKVGIDSVLDGMEHAFDQIGTFAYNGAVIRLCSCLNKICQPVKNAIQNYLDMMGREGSYDIIGAQKEKRRTNAVFSEEQYEYIDHGQDRVSPRGRLSDPEHRTYAALTDGGIRHTVAAVHGGELRSGIRYPADPGEAGRDRAESTGRGDREDNAVGGRVLPEASGDPADDRHHGTRQEDGDGARDGGRRNPATDSIPLQRIVSVPAPDSVSEEEQEATITPSIPGETEQVATIKRAAREETTPAAFLVSDDEINETLRSGSGFGTQRIQLLLGELAYINDAASLARALKEDFELREGEPVSKGFLINQNYISVLMDTAGVSFTKGMRSDGRDVTLSWEEISERLISLYKRADLVREEYAAGAEEVYLNAVAESITVYFRNRKGVDRYEKYKALPFFNDSSFTPGIQGEKKAVLSALKGSGTQVLREVFSDSEDHPTELLLMHLDAIASGEAKTIQANTHEPVTEAFIPQDEVIRSAIHYAVPYDRESLFPMLAYFEESRNGEKEKTRYLKNKCSNSGSGSINGLITGLSDSICITQNGISAEITYKALAREIDEMVKAGTFLPEGEEESYRTYLENLRLAGTTYTILSGDGGQVQAEGLPLNDMLRYLKEDPSRSATAIMRGTNGITIPYPVVREGVLCPEELYRSWQQREPGSGIAPDSRSGERDYTLMDHIMRNDIPSIVEAFPEMKIIPSAATLFQKPALVKILESNNAAFHEAGWSLPVPDTEGLFSGLMDFNVFARYIEEISGRYASAQEPVFVTYVSFEVTANTEGIHRTLVKGGTYRHTIWFEKGMEKIHLRSLICDTTTSEDEKFLLSEEYETESVKELRRGSDQAFYLMAGDTSPVMVRPDEGSIREITLCAPDAYQDGKPLYLSVVQAVNHEHIENALTWEISAYHGAEEVMERTSINRLTPDIMASENFYLKDAVTTFLTNSLHMDGPDILRSLRPVEDVAFHAMRDEFITSGRELVIPVPDITHPYVPFPGAEELTENASVSFDASGPEFAWRFSYDIPYGMKKGHYEYTQSGLLSYRALCQLTGTAPQEGDARFTDLSEVSRASTMSTAGDEAADATVPDAFERGDVFEFNGETYVVMTASGSGTNGLLYATLEGDLNSEESLYAIIYRGDFRRFLTYDGTFINQHRRITVPDDESGDKNPLRPENGDVIRTPGGIYVVDSVYPGDICSLKNTDPEADRQRVTYEGGIPAPYQVTYRTSWPRYIPPGPIQEDLRPAGSFPFDTAQEGERFDYNKSAYTLLSTDHETGKKTFRVEHGTGNLQAGDRFEWNGQLYEVLQTVPSSPYLERVPKGIYAYSLSEEGGRFAVELYGNYEKILNEGRYNPHPLPRTVTVSEGTQMSYHTQLETGNEVPESGKERLRAARWLSYDYPALTGEGEKTEIRRPMDILHTGDTILIDGEEKTVVSKRGGSIFLKASPEDSAEEEQRLDDLPDAFAVTNRVNFRYRSVYDEAKERLDALLSEKEDARSIADQERMPNLPWIEAGITSLSALLSDHRKEEGSLTRIPAEEVPETAEETETFLFDGIREGDAFTFRGRIFRFEREAPDSGKEYSFWNTIETAKSGDRFLYRGSVYEIMNRTGENGSWSQPGGISFAHRLPAGLQAVCISENASRYGVEIYGNYAEALTRDEGFLFLPLKRQATYYAPLSSLPEESGIIINETAFSERPLSSLLSYDYHYLRKTAPHQSLFTEEGGGIFQKNNARDYEIPSGLAHTIGEGDIIRFTASGRLGDVEKTYVIRKKAGSALFGSEAGSEESAKGPEIKALHPLPETIEIIHRQNWPQESVPKQVSEEIAKVERRIYALQNEGGSAGDSMELENLKERARTLRLLYDSFSEYRENSLQGNDVQQTPHPKEAAATSSPNDLENLSFDAKKELPAPGRLLAGVSAGNYKITDDLFQTATAQVRARRNIEAIRLLKKIEGENRYATKPEQDILARYVGWGGLSMCFEDNGELRSETEELRAILTKEEYEAARESTLTAFFTPPEVIRAIYGTLLRMGFRDGSILEPAMGTGNFFGLLPEEMSQSRLLGVETDPVSVRIARLLYPESSRLIGSAYESADLPDNYYDLAIGNVPFGSFSVADRRYDRYHFPIHEYFIAKTLDKVRPGGVAALICSRHLLDKKDSSTRRYLARKADLLGAVRLPEETFSGAAGTDALSDILFFKKRDSFSEDEPEWVFTQVLEGQGEEARYNLYFQNHPEMAVGTPELSIGQWGLRPTWRLSGQSLSKELEKSLENIKGSIENSPAVMPGLPDIDSESLPADPDQMNFTYTEHDGGIYFKENTRMYRVNLQGKRLERIRGMIRIREAMLRLVQAEGTGGDETAIAGFRNELNSAYDSFVKKNGHICEAGNRRAFQDDASYCLIASLEDTNEHNEFLKKSAMFEKRTIRPVRPSDHADTAGDALTLSLRMKGRVDMEYMTAISSIPEDKLALELAGRIYKDPESGLYLSADDYLSGNTREKLKAAQKAASKDAQYNANVQALEKALPKWVSAPEIEVHMGAAWIDVSLYEQFMYEYLETGNDFRRGGRFTYNWITINYDALTATYSVNGKERGNGWSVASHTRGTTRANGYYLMEQSLNQKSVQIRDAHVLPDGKIDYGLNFPATQAAQEKQRDLERAFESWIFRDRNRRQALEEKYNTMFNSITPRKYDGSLLDFPGMNPMIDLMDHQRSGVARIVLNHTNTLLGHVVGAGKTFEMIAGCMERKRLGLSQKALFVVPNHLVEQWGQDFYRLYPGCHILVATQNDFQKNNRRRLFSRMATGDYDAIIIGHSQFTKLPLSKEKEVQYMRSEIQAITDGIKSYGTGQPATVKVLERKKKALETNLKRLSSRDTKDDVIPFDFLGIDALYVDEAHKFKNLGFDTKKSRIAGVSNSPSQRATDLYLKTRYINEVSGGTGIVFATGTPVSNTMSELYTLMRYLQYPLLKEKGLATFDAWAAQFGLTIMSYELNSLGTGYRSKERFARFFNLPELLGMFKMSCDIKTADDLDLPTPAVEYHTEETEKSVYQQFIMQELENRADAIHRKIVDPRDDNMLKVTMDGRRVALDQRLYNLDLGESEDCKVRKCANNVLALYRETEKDKGAQLVFCDQSVPNGKVPFNVYDELKKLLTEGGISEGEVQFIQDASSDAKKRELFAQVRSGSVRVLIGSTEKMGAGMNVQDRLIALHHLDVPWRPSDIEQREGRILRQGNMYEKVHIFRYVTKETFDAYSWQVLESKAKFISQVMNTKNVSRSAEDIDENVLSYAEVKALCTGNDDIRRQIMLTAEVSRLKMARIAFMREQERLEDNVTRIYPHRIKELSDSIHLNKADLALYEENRSSAESFVFSFTETETRNRAEAGKQIRKLLRETRASGDNIPVGTYLGFEIRGQYAPFKTDGSSGSYMLVAKANAMHRFPASGSGAVLMDSLDNSFSGIRNQVEQLEKAKAECEKNMEEEKHLLGQAWNKEEEYQEKMTELAELNARLNLDKPELSRQSYEISDAAEDFSQEISTIERAEDIEKAPEKRRVSSDQNDESANGAQELYSDHVLQDPFKILKKRGDYFLREGDIIYYERTRYLVEEAGEGGLLLKRYSRPEDCDYKKSSKSVISFNQNWINNEQLKAALVIGQAFTKEDTGLDAWHKFLKMYTREDTREILHAIEHPNLNLPIPNINPCRR